MNRYVTGRQLDEMSDRIWTDGQTLTGAARIVAEEARKEVFRGAQRGASGSTSGWSNLVERERLAAVANVVERLDRGF